MSATTMRILVIGALSSGTIEILQRFSDRGWGSRQVVTLQQARDELATFDFDIVLATEFLCDGRGYDIADSVAQHSQTLLVGVALSESCLWLPVVERGSSVLGRRALNTQALESEMRKLMCTRENVRDISSRPAFVAARIAPQRSTTLRRKYRDRDIESA